MKRIHTYGSAENTCVVIDSAHEKLTLSHQYNYTFSKQTGFFARWGKTKEDDPEWSPFGPEILDIEIMTGGCNARCPWCYKDNKPEPGEIMTAKKFSEILDKFPKTLTQVALGITDIDKHPELLDILKECRSRGIVPNFTMTGIGRENVDMKKIVNLVGAIAVSVYPHTKDIAYDTVQQLTQLGLVQTNIHLFLSHETLSFVNEVISDRADKDKGQRLKNMNAIVFLNVKPKGRATKTFHQIAHDDFLKLIKRCFDLGLPFGFDSCGAPRFESAVRSFEFLTDEQSKRLLQCSESCESFGLFSSYVNAKGDYFPCSFAEGERGWEEGIGVLGCRDFLKDLWLSPRVNEWRKLSLQTRDRNGCRQCLVFEELNN